MVVDKQEAGDLMVANQVNTMNEAFSLPLPSVFPTMSI